MIDILQQYRTHASEDCNDAEYDLLKQRLNKNMGYTDLGRITYGKLGAFVVTFCVIVTQLGFCVGYSIFIGNMLHALVVPEPNHVLSETTVTEQVLSFMKRDVPVFSNASLSNVTFDNVLQEASNVSDRVIQSYTDSTSNGGRITTTSSTSVFLTSDIPESTSSENGVNSATVVPTETLSSDSALIFLVFLTLPLFVVFTMFRSVRQMSVISMLANISIILGFFCVLCYIGVSKYAYVYFTFTVEDVYCNELSQFCLIIICISFCYYKYRTRSVL